jgi:hypothetical protein
MLQLGTEVNKQSKPSKQTGSTTNHENLSPDPYFFVSCQEIRSLQVDDHQGSADDATWHDLSRGNLYPGFDMS